MSALEIRNLDARHGQLRAVRGVSLTIPQGEVLALVGANGAGKTTLLRAIAGAHKCEGGAVLIGGRDVSALKPFERVRAGLSLVPEGRKLFGELSVEENLLLGGTAKRPGPWTTDAVYEAFPNLKRLRHSKAANLSGGEQQATAIGRALMSNPSILLLDEISLGLSPAAVDLVYASLQALLTAGTTILLVEQDLGRAMSNASRAACMLEGEIVLDKPVANVTREEITDAYFGKGKTRAHA